MSYIKVVKETTDIIREKYDFTEVLNSQQLEEINNIVKSTYLKQPFFWKAKNSIKEYSNLIMLDLKYKFIGGVKV